MLNQDKLVWPWVIKMLTNHSLLEVKEKSMSVTLHSFRNSVSFSVFKRIKCSFLQNLAQNSLDTLPEQLLFPAAKRTGKHCFLLKTVFTSLISVALKYCDLSGMNCFRRSQTVSNIFKSVHYILNTWNARKIFTMIPLFVSSKASLHS